MSILRKEAWILRLLFFSDFPFQLYIKAALDGGVDLPPLVWLEEAAAKKLENTIGKNIWDRNKQISEQQKKQ